MTDNEIITAHFDGEELARIDALAQARGITRDEMVHKLVRTGLVVCEQADAPPASHRRGSGPAS